MKHSAQTMHKRVMRNEILEKAKRAPYWGPELKTQFLDNERRQTCTNNAQTIPIGGNFI